MTTRSQHSPTLSYWQNWRHVSCHCPTSLLRLVLKILILSIQVLGLNENEIRNEGIITLASALPTEARLKELRLGNNFSNYVGVRALCRAAARGAFAQLKYLDLQEDEDEDNRKTNYYDLWELCDAFTGGHLPQLKTLVMRSARRHARLGTPFVHSRIRLKRVSPLPFPW